MARFKYPSVQPKHKDGQRNYYFGCLSLNRDMGRCSLHIKRRRFSFWPVKCGYGTEELLGNMANINESHHFAEPMPTNPGFNSLIEPNNEVESDQSHVIPNNMTGLGTSLPVKRKADAGSMTSNTSSQQVQCPNKRSLHLAYDVKLHGYVQPSNRAAPERPSPGSPGLQAQSALSKKTVQPAKRQTTQSVSEPKSWFESSEAVRSKMRESLAAALELASQKLDNVSNTKKDKNNPELRLRVMSGEISPEKLCSMSAEELASKELSQWRMTKAEEHAQMVVLPDREDEMRRLVKKTHKGEYQVEFERVDGIVDEVSGGTSVLTLPLQEKVSPPKVSGKDEENVANTRENDGTDLMQGMKTNAQLPQIVKDLIFVHDGCIYYFGFLSLNRDMDRCSWHIK